jgi:hypothetical protein
MFDVSLPWANFWYDAFNVILFVGALAVAVGTYGSIKMGAVRERFSDERIAANEAEAKRAIAESDKANAALEVAKGDIAKANAEAARANERSAELKLALEREVAARQPRTISKEQHDGIVRYLGNASPKGEVIVLWKIFDEEAEKFGKQVLDVLNDAGFAAKEGHGPLSFGEKGAWIVVRDIEHFNKTPTAVGAVQGAFRDILHIEFNGVQRKDPFPDLGRWLSR